MSDWSSLVSSGVRVREEVYFAASVARMVRTVMRWAESCEEVGSSGREVGDEAMVVLLLVARRDRLGGRMFCWEAFCALARCYQSGKG